ncbi:MAG: hypothetical protein VKI82_16055 [Leptolyngbya sp.]|nr:hypothetical protein [Leptolyngbya sp.]
MFQLYFGAFDLVLYLGGLYAAMTLAKAICDQMDAAEDRPVGQATEADVAERASETHSVMAPMQPIPAHLAAPVAKRDQVSVKVSVQG